MNPVIFTHGINHVTYDSYEVIPNNVQLYYWHNSANQYKPVGTLMDIKNMGIFGTNYVNGNLDGVISRLGNVDNVVLYYNSIPNVPIVHTAPNVAISVEPIRLPTLLPTLSPTLSPIQTQTQTRTPTLSQAQLSITFPQNAIAIEDSENRVLCNICYIKTKNIVFNCGHSICSDCNNCLKNRICPFCKKHITTITPLFL